MGDDYLCVEGGLENWWIILVLEEGKSTLDWDENMYTIHVYKYR